MSHAEAPGHPAAALLLCRRPRPRRARRHARPPAPADRRPSRANAGIMRYDTNKDGVVDRAEWKAGQEARFKQLDTNKRRQAHPGRAVRAHAGGRQQRAALRPPGRAAVEPTSSVSTPTRTASSPWTSSWPRPTATSRAATSNKDGRRRHRRMPAGAAAQVGSTAHPYPLAEERPPRWRPFPRRLMGAQVLSACMTSPNSSQVSPLKRESWTAWIG